MAVAVLFNTCDNFSDLWKNFFDCYYKFWNPPYKIYINSETRDYEDERFEIVNIHPDKEMPWSNRLSNCVNSIEEEYIICIEEECLIEEVVDSGQVEMALLMFEQIADMAGIWLMHIPGDVTEDKTYMPYRERKYNYRNLITQQVCIWKKERWLHYIRPNENPWEYECLGSARGVLHNDRFFVVDNQEPEVVKYGYGFIVYRGYWCKEEKERLECKLGITFDENKRKTDTKENIDAKTNQNFWFYNRLRIKKWFILIMKHIFKKDYARER